MTPCLWQKNRLYTPLLSGSSTTGRKHTSVPQVKTIWWLDMRYYPCWVSSRPMYVNRRTLQRTSGKLVPLPFFPSSLSPTPYPFRRLLRRLQGNGKIRQQRRKFIHLKILSNIKKQNKTAITKKKTKRKQQEKKKRSESVRFELGTFGTLAHIVTTRPHSLYVAETDVFAGYIACVASVRKG